jgi:hypothetical protein
MALELLLRKYRDNDMTRDMLTIPNRIDAMISEIIVEVKNENGEWESSPLSEGFNLLPDYEYGDDGMRK